MIIIGAVMGLVLIIIVIGFMAIAVLFGRRRTLKVPSREEDRRDPSASKRVALPVNFIPAPPPNFAFAPISKKLRENVMSSTRSESDIFAPSMGESKLLRKRNMFVSIDTQAPSP